MYNNMVKKLILFTALLFCPFICFSQTYKTEAYTHEIKTIQVKADGEWNTSPVIDLGGSVVINFDRLYENSFNRLRYKVIHCSADWTESSLSPIEYLDGFNDNLIDDYATSISTGFDYTNFQLEIPNNDLSLKVSGNYAVIVYEEDYPDNVMLSACFSVVESQIAISGSMTSNTLIDSNREHQQIAFTIVPSGLNIRDPFTDLKVFVKQNDRLDNQKKYVKPTYIQPNKLIYEQNRELIFEAGNEYRRFETVSHRYNGLRVLHIEYRNPYYHAYIIPDKIRADRSYVYDEDQDGRFMIRNAEAINSSDTEGDYFFVHFTLEAGLPFREDIYITGGFTNNTIDDTYMMQYDYDRNEYHITLLLKQGTYNYMYMTENEGVLSAATAEGNYYETENSYQIYVYYCPPGQRYDSLIGFLNIKK